MFRLRMVVLQAVCPWVEPQVVCLLVELRVVCL
jgi:hypothetical protein